LVFSWNQFTLEEFAGQKVAAWTQPLFMKFVALVPRLRA